MAKKKLLDYKDCSTLNEDIRFSDLELNMENVIILLAQIENKFSCTVPKVDDFLDYSISQFADYIVDQKN